MNWPNTKECIRDTLITIWDSYKIILTLASAIPLGFVLFVKDEILLDESAITIIQLITAPLVGSYIFIALIMLVYSVVSLLNNFFMNKADSNSKPHFSNLIASFCLIGIAFITKSLIFQQINAGQEKIISERATKYNDEQTRSLRVETFKKLTILEAKIDSHTKTINDIDSKLKETTSNQVVLIGQNKSLKSTIAEQDLALDKLRKELKELKIKMTANN